MASAMGVKIFSAKPHFDVNVFVAVSALLWQLSVSSFTGHYF